MRKIEHELHDILAQDETTNTYSSAAAASATDAGGSPHRRSSVDSVVHPITPPAPLPAPQLGQAMKDSYKMLDSRSSSGLLSVAATDEKLSRVNSQLSEAGAGAGAGASAGNYMEVNNSNSTEEEMKAEVQGKGGLSLDSSVLGNNNEDALVITESVVRVRPLVKPHHDVVHEHFLYPGVVSPTDSQLFHSHSSHGHGHGHPHSNSHQDLDVVPAAGVAAAVATGSHLLVRPGRADTPVTHDQQQQRRQFEVTDAIWPAVGGDREVFAASSVQSSTASSVPVSGTVTPTTSTSGVMAQIGSDTDSVGEKRSATVAGIAVDSDGRGAAGSGASGAGSSDSMVISSSTQDAASETQCVLELFETATTCVRRLKVCVFAIRL
jgi:hypothetical protein